MTKPKQDKFVEYGGVRYVRVTTVLDQFVSFGLINWMIYQARPCSSCHANRNCAIQNNFAPTEKMTKDTFSCLAWRGVDKGTEAADFGTSAHRQLEDYVTGHYVDLSDKNPVAKTIKPAIDWMKQVNLKAIDYEQTIISTKYGYGGHLDLLAEVNGTLAVVDWKTSKQIRWTYLLQVAAYYYAYIEMNPDKPAKDLYILRLPKVEGEDKVEVMKIKRIDELFRAFLKALDLYNMGKELSTPKRIREWMEGAVV